MVVGLSNLKYWLGLSIFPISPKDMGPTHSISGREYRPNTAFRMCIANILSSILTVAHVVGDGDLGF